jgi:hypothetical protein
VYRFIQPNPTVKLASGRKIDSKRVNFSTKEEVPRYFDLLKAVKEEYGILEEIDLLRISESFDIPDPPG